MKYFRIYNGSNHRKQINKSYKSRITGVSGFFEIQKELRSEETYNKLVYKKKNFYLVFQSLEARFFPIATP